MTQHRLSQLLSDCQRDWLEGKRDVFFANALAQLSNARYWLGLAVTLAGTFVAVLDHFIVFVAIPSIRANLGATFGQAELVVAAYTLTFAIGVITGGRPGDRFGRRRAFMIGFAAFSLASGVCGCAPSPTTLLLARIVQGLSSAVLSPQVLAMIRVTSPIPGSVRRPSPSWGW